MAYAGQFDTANFKRQVEREMKARKDRWRAELEAAETMDEVKAVVAQIITWMK